MGVRRTSRWVVVTAALIMASGLLAACGEPSTVGSGTPTTVTTVVRIDTPGPRTDEGKQAADAAAAAGAGEAVVATTTTALPLGRLEVVVTDRKGRPRSGVPVRASGPATYEGTSDAGGRVGFDVVTGTYEVAAIAGCAATIEVLDAATGSAAVPPGQQVTGPLTLGWRHRYVPNTDHHVSDWRRADGQPESRDTSLPRWTRGVDYEVTVPVIDRCGGGDLAPGQAIEGWRATTSSNAQVVDQGTGQAGPDGRLRVIARCQSDGAITLTMVSSEDDEPDVDVLARSANGFGKPSCTP